MTVVAVTSCAFFSVFTSIVQRGAEGVVDVSS